MEQRLHIRNAISDFYKSKARLHDVLTNLDTFAIGLAFETNGYGGMRPLSATFKTVNANGHYVYECTYWDDDLDDGSLHRANAYIELQTDGKLIAET